MAAHMGAIPDLLARRIGLDPVSVGPTQITRASQQRMQELGLTDIGEYESRVSRSESELQLLIEEIVVSESWFFRDERPFEYLKAHIRERWLRDPFHPPLRILSLACAGGEEPYSIAMSLRELGLTAHRFHIDAVDISARRLAIARRGVYSANSFRGSDLGFRARHFREHPHGYELDASIRATIAFHQASVLELPPLEASSPYDVVFCRNLLIYLETSARLRVMTSIDKLLAADGLLFIGHAERVDYLGGQPKFIAVGDPGCFAYRRAERSDIQVACVRPEPPVTPEPTKPHVTRVVPAQADLPSSAQTATQFARINALAQSWEGEPPGEPRCNPARTEPRPPGTSQGRLDAAAIGSHHVNEPPLLDQAAELANRGLFDEAIATCERHLQSQGLSAPAYFLMGMICQAAGNRQQAESCFHKTVYLDPLHDEALLALALLAERRGDQTSAAGFRRRAELSVARSRKRVN
jgi:chemotaxis protein methyltransferase WspC